MISSREDTDMHLSAEWAGEAITWLKRHKVKTRPLLAELGIDDRQLGFGQQIPIRYFATILDYGAAEAHDTHFGLHRGSEFQIRNGGILGYLAASADTVADAIMSYQRYAAVVSNGFALDVKPERDGVRLVLQVSDPVWKTCRHLGEFTAARTIAALREITGVNLHPLRLAFMHPHAERTLECRRFFHCHIGHSPGGDTIKLSREVLALPIPTADSHLGQVLRSYADGLLLQVRTRKGRSLERRVESVVLQRLTSGRISLREVAAEMNMSDRTLRRRLQEANVKFGAILDRIRQELAGQWLSRTDFDLKHISFLLGYSEPAAFSRAYKRWTGLTPGRARPR